MRRILYSIVLCCFVQSASAQCNAIITPSGPTTFCDGNSVELAGSPGNTYQWYLDGNSIPGATNATYTADAAGSYTVETDSAGCVSMSAPVVVTVNTVPAQPGPITGPTTACEGATLTYTVSTVPDAISYTWTNNFATLSGTTNSVQITGGVMQYHINVTANNSCGSSAPSPTFIANGAGVPNNTGLVYMPDGNPICPGDVEHMSFLVAHPGDIFTFYKNGSVVQTGASQGYGATSSGTYYCIITNSSGCSAQSNSHNINFSPAPAQPVIIQAGPSITTTQIYSSWTWYLNGSAVGNGQYHYTTQDGDYKVVVSNNIPCYSESATFVVDYTDIDMMEHNDGILIHPNPNTGVFTLSGSFHSEGKAVTITITDITGKQIMSKDIRIQNGTIEEQVQLDNNIAPGLYFLKLNSAGFNKTISFVKQ